MHALYFKHRETGELRRYQSREPGTRAEIEAAALQARRAEAVSNTADEWETVALPLDSEVPAELTQAP